MRQIRMLRAMRRGLETDYGDFYTGTQGETPDTAKELPTNYRASSRPYQGCRARAQLIPTLRNAYVSTRPRAAINRPSRRSCWRSRRKVALA